MKTTMLFLVTLVTVHLVFANDGKYLDIMGKNIQAVYTAQNITELQNSINAFERIGATEKTKWEPFYYASFGYIMIANREQDGAKKDSYLDLAATSLEKAKAIVPNESEVIALEGFIYTIRVTVDPVSRGQQYSTLAMQSFGKALAINQDNPRALGLMAQMQYGTAQFFHSSTAEACGMAAKAIEKFGSFKSDNPLAPRWGKEMTEGLLGKCK